MPSTLLSSRNDRSSTETKRTSWPRRWAASARWTVAKVGCCSLWAATTKQTRMGLTWASGLGRREGVPVAAQDLGELVEGQPGRDVLVLAAHLVAHAQRVDDGLLGALDGGLVQGIAGLVEQHLERRRHARGLARHDVGRREGHDDLARAVRRERPDAADAERGALAHAHELRREQGRVGRDDRDDRARVALAARLAGRKKSRLEHLANR